MHIYTYYVCGVGHEGVSQYTLGDGTLDAFELKVIYVCLHVRIYIFVLYIYLYVHIYIYIYTYMYILCVWVKT